MRFLLTILIFIILSDTSFAQTSSGKGKISGTVIDAITKEPIDFATITVFKIGTKEVVNGISSDAKGNFTVSGLPNGIYRVSVDFIGYKATVFDPVTISATAPTVTLGTILVVSTVDQLQSVTVTAKTPIIENKIDKTVYNTANDLTAQNGVALDVLKKVPMVSVDIDGNVELQGSASVRFLINGKPSSIFGASLADALQSIPASQIKSVEVITSPGAKYDANGTGGIINIVLKDNKFQGINGSINYSVGTRLQNGSLNLNIKKGNFGAGVFFSGNQQFNTMSKNTLDRISYNSARDTISKFFQDGNSPQKRASYQTGLNLNWSISSKDELTATLGYNHFNNNTTGVNSQIQEYLLASSGKTISDLKSLRNSSSNFSANSTDLSLAYKKTFNKDGHELDFLYNASFGNNLVNTSQVSTYQGGNFPTTGLNSSNPGKENETEISVNYALPLNKKFTIESGAKVLIDNLNNSVVTDTLLSTGSYINNTNQSYGFNYRRNVYAAYLSASFTLFKDFITGKAGIRYERTGKVADFSGTEIAGYNTFAPSFTLQHKLDDSQSIKLSYTYRIERPDYGDLNPFYNISDPHNISTGNPLLKPEIGNNFELGYSKNFKNGANIYFAGYYRRNSDDMQQLTTYYDILSINGTDYDAVSLTKRLNLGNQTSVGASLFASVPVTDKFNLRTNIQAGNRNNVSPGLAGVSAFSYRANINASYDFGNNLLAEVFGNYNSTQKNLRSTRPAVFNYSLAVRKQFLGKNASIGLTAANPFNRYIKQRQTSFGPNFDQTNLRMVPVQSFGLTLSYKFGKLQFNKDSREDNAPQLPDVGAGK
ncbi:TonB-dependent receptor domain-containing protein [Pedobacter fastidiosus]|uniref:TonB-dependent receptor n=1 Tax=Pedobacter fastidiosus TaxID=2765361 RepID=A0ABR7KXD2_9SPHI|nr:TonB-dependent receptor [Pedobacter fastidiosus]MBC6112490.1 TonB-dependent receptor [Pedobacter fastidiosus]